MSKEPTKGGAPGKSPGTKAKRKLTREEKKQIAAIIRQAKGDGKAHTAQQTIPYINLYPDGICRVTERKYSKSIAYEDINYQLAQADDKTAIFENWCDFLNYFDASVSVQLSFINQGTQREEAEKAINIPAQDDAFNSIRTEYGDMLKSQLSKGNKPIMSAAAKQTICRFVRLKATFVFIFDKSFGSDIYFSVFFIEWKYKNRSNIGRISSSTCFHRTIYCEYF